MRTRAGLMLLGVRLAGVAGALALAAASPAAEDAGPIVRVDGGALHGFADGTVQRFEGIPFAAPPVGALRWRPPQAFAPWAGVREATAFGAACPQRGAPLHPQPGEAATSSEDCLTLNVWTPVAHASPRPVMVWLHGGGNTSGTAADTFTTGDAFARDGVVLVSANYRLGLLGFFAAPAVVESGTSGNFGLMDQLAALRWVQQNIAAFGGDPNNVTVFGESAGGEDVIIALTLPAARGLFARAIAESPAFWANLPAESDARATAAGALRSMKLPPDASAARLRALDLGIIAAADHDIDMGPYVDGTFIPRDPLAAFAHGDAASIPLIVGTNGNEGSLLGAATVAPADVLEHATAMQLAALRNAYGGQADGDDAYARLVFRDRYFAEPARWLAAHRGNAPTYLYRFDYILERLRERRGGANHGSEIPFVFDSFPAFIMSQNDMGVAALVHGCWIAFAKSGTPACPNAPAWPPYDASADRLMLFGDSAAIVRSPDAGALDQIGARTLAPFVH